MAPPVTGVLETSLYVADLDRAESFWRGLFGFPPFVRDERMAALGVPGGGVLLLFLRGASTLPGETPGGVIPPHDGQGTQHLAFAIPAAALAAWDAHLRARGIAVESRVVWPRGGTSLYFRDPDGHSIEVATPGLWPGR